MPELKAALEEQCFQNVLTYINSGNVFFDSDMSESDAKITCEAVVNSTFGLDIPIRITTAAELREVLDNAPDWWGNADDSIHHDAIFVISPTTVGEVCAKVGEPKPEYEKIACSMRVILWSASLANYSRTRWSKIAGNKEIRNTVTVRNANTTRKLLELAERD